MCSCSKSKESREPLVVARLESFSGLFFEFGVNFFNDGRVLLYFGNFVGEEVLALAHHCKEECTKIFIFKELFFDFFTEPVTKFHK